MTTVRGATNGLMVAALLGTALAAPFILMRWLTRQPFYIMGAPHWSAAGGAIYFVVSLVVLVVLRSTGLLSAFTGLLMMGFAAFVAAATLTLTRIRPKLRFERTEDLATSKIMRDHFEYGKWSTSNRVLQWLASNFGYLVVPLIAGLAGTASLRALNNLIMPLFQINASLIALLVPSFVRAYESQGAAALDARVRKMLLAGVGLTSLYALAVIVLGGPVMHLIYGGKYDHVATLPFLVATALLPVIYTCSQITNAALNAMRKVKYTFLARLLPTALTVILDVLFLLTIGLIGVPLESLITAGLVFFTVWRFYRRQISAPKPPDAGAPAPTA
jgi:O-antigen/teichoic acid export membrane protein